MTARKTSAVFLERQAYHRRRMRDLARAVPIFGAVVWCIPLLWVRAGADVAAATTSQALVYVFVVWMFLIAVAVVISRAVKSEPPPVEPTAPR
ncbi:hypothetical protein [Yoonia sp. MH D7]